MVLNNPITQTVLKPLEVLDYGRRAAILGLEEVAEGLTGRDTHGTEDDDRSNLEKLKDPSYGVGQLLGDVTGNKWIDRAIGFAGDVALDPLTYATFGIGGAAKAGTAGVGRAARAGKIADAVAELGAAGELSDEALRGLQRVGSKGLGVADESLLPALKMNKPGLRFELPFSDISTPVIPGTERLGRAVHETSGAVRGALNASPKVQDFLRGRTPEELEKAMRSLTSGAAPREEFLAAADTVRQNRKFRRYAGTFAELGARQVDSTMKEVETELKDYGGDMTRYLAATEDVNGPETALNRLSKWTVQTAKDMYGVDLPELEGLEYLPHILSPEFKKLLGKGGADAEAFKAAAGLVTRDTTRDSGFLSARALRPNADGTPKFIKVGGRTMQIDTGTVEEINSKIKQLFPGFEGTALETNPQTIFERYMTGVAGDVGYRKSRAEMAGEFGENIVPDPVLDDVTQRVRQADGTRTPDPFADNPYVVGSKVEDETAALNQRVAEQAQQTIAENRPFADLARTEVATEAGQLRDEIAAPMIQRNRKIGREMASLDGQVNDLTASIKDVGLRKRRARYLAKNTIDGLRTEADQITKDIRALKRTTARMTQEQVRDHISTINTRMNRLLDEAESINRILTGDGSAETREALNLLKGERDDLYKRVGLVTQEAEKAQPHLRGRVTPEEAETIGTVVEADTRQAVPPAERVPTEVPEPLHGAKVEEPVVPVEAAAPAQTPEAVTLQQEVNARREAVRRREQAQQALDRNRLSQQNPMEKTTGGNYQYHGGGRGSGDVYEINKVSRNTYDVIDPYGKKVGTYEGLDNAGNAAEKDWFDYTTKVRKSNAAELPTPTPRRAANARAQAQKLKNELAAAKKAAAKAERELPGLEAKLAALEAAAPKVAAATAEPAPGMVRLWRGVPEQAGMSAEEAAAAREARGLGWINEQPEMQARNEVQGRWATTDPELAAKYPTNMDPGEGRRTMYVDIPQEEFDRIKGLADQPENIRALSVAKEHEVVLPAEYMDQLQDAKLIPKPTPAIEPDRMAALKRVPVANNRPEFEAFLTKHGLTEAEWNEMFPGPPKSSSRIREAESMEQIAAQAEEAGRRWRMPANSNDERLAYFATDAEFERIESLERQIKGRQEALDAARAKVQDDEGVKKLRRILQNRRKNSPERVTAERNLEAGIRAAEEKYKTKEISDLIESTRRDLTRDYTNLYDSELSQKYRRFKLGLDREKYLADVNPEPWARATMEEFINKRASQVQSGELSNAAARAPGVEQALGRTRQELGASLRAGKEGAPPSGAQRIIEQNTGELDQSVRQMENRRGQLRQGAKEVPVELQHEVDRLTQEGTGYAENVAELQTNKVALQNERAEIKKALEAAPPSRKASTRMTRTEKEVGDVVDTGLRPTAKDLGEVNVTDPGLYRVQPLESSLADIEEMIRLNPLMDDASLAGAEARLHDYRRRLTNATVQDIKAKQADEVLKAAGTNDFVEVVRAKVRQEYDLAPEGGILIHKQFAAMNQVLDNWAKQPGALGSLMNSYTNFFKTYATLSIGFHVRNSMSASFMNSVDGVPARRQIQGVGLWSKYMDSAKKGEGADFLVNLRREQPQLADAFEAVFGTGAGGRYGEAGFAESTAIRRTRMKEKVYRNWATTMSQRWGGNVEGAVRLGMAIDSVKRGASVEAAIDRITRIHFDYSQVSRFDAKAKQVIPFWTFMSRNLPMQITEMWTKPRGYAIYNSFLRNFASPPAEGTPEYLLEGGAFNTGLTTPDWLPGAAEGMPIMLSPDLPHQRVDADINALAGIADFSDVGKALTSLNPLISAPWEYATGTDMFTGQQFGPTDYRKAEGTLDMAMLPLMALLRQVKKGSDGNLYYQEKGVNAMRALNPLLDRGTRLFPSQSGAGGDPDRTAENVARIGLGLPVRTISEKQIEGQKRSKRFDLQEQRAMERILAGG